MISNYKFNNLFTNCLIVFISINLWYNKSMKTLQSSTPPNYRSYLALSIPLIISTVTTPLLGAVDTAVVGHLSSSIYIGGVAIGTLIFNTLYWLFGFLRVSTSGFAAQAKGAGELERGFSELVRPTIIALLIGFLFIVLQYPILQGVLAWIRPDADIREQASIYFHIRIWGAPVTLLNYVILGWLIGMAHVRQTLFVQIGINVLNMILAIVFVHVFHWQVAGVASATLIAEIIGLVFGIFLICRSPYFKWGSISQAGLFNREALRRMISVNSDLFIRTICLLAMFNIFTANSTSFGPEMLAANAILLQVHYIMAYFFDGFANASSIYAGQAGGSRNPLLLQQTIRWSWYSSFLPALLIVIVYWVFHQPLLGLFTDSASTIALANEYSPWLLLFPLVTGAGLVFYGLFTGLSVTAPIRNSMIISFVLFVAVLWIAVPLYGNHGLWLAFIVFGLARSVFLLIRLPRLLEAVPTKS